jgi:hypothetical protein
MQIEAILPDRALFVKRMGGYHQPPAPLRTHLPTRPQVRAGVGHLAIVDGDVVDVTNKNRQVHAMICTMWDQLLVCTLGADGG